MTIPLQLLRRKSKEKDKTLLVPDLSQPNAASVGESSKRLLAIRLRSKRIKPSVTDPFMCPISRDVNHYIAKQVMSNPLWNRYNKYDRLIQNALKVCPAHLRPAMCQIDQVKDYLRNCKMNEAKEYISPAMKKWNLSDMRNKVETGRIGDARNSLALGKVTRAEFRKAMSDFGVPLDSPDRINVEYAKKQESTATQKLYLAPKSLQPQIVAIENGVIVSVMNHFDHDRNIVAVEGDEIDVQRYVSGLEPFEGDVQDFVSERKRK